MSKSLFDMLGIDESAGIDTDEVEAIQRLLERVKVEAAQVAKVNDTATTKALLTEMVAAVRRVGSVTSVDELHQNLATSHSGAPARALGAAPAAPTDPRTAAENAFQVLMSADDSVVPRGSKALLRRALTPGDPEFIRTDADGTPVEIQALQRQIAQLTTQRDNALAAQKTAEDALKDARDKSKPGSLAHQLEAARAATPAPLPADMVEKDKVKTLVDELNLNNVSNRIGGHATLRDVSPATVRRIKNELDGLLR